MTKKRIGNYYILKQIGEGGFARTYLAEHTILKQMACLKQNINLSKEDTALLIQEATLLWEIHHHSLPSLRDFIDCGDGSFAMIMSYISGKDLFKIKEEDYAQGISPEHVCWMTQRCLGGLRYLHHHGVVHNDVKPHNMIVQPREHNVFMVDYGLSTLRPDRYTKCPGYTPAFAAPEQIQGKPPIPETDIFGLGLTMIYALGGDIGTKQMPSSVPKQLQEYFLRMVKYDPLSRPRNAIELTDELLALRKKLFGRTSSGEDFVIS
ncbi:MAG: serine/threonine-protein kinase [Patescibacteria group bacterium]